MKYLLKTIEYGLYLLVFLLPLQTRWVIKAGELNNGSWEYGTYSLYGTDILLVSVLLLFVIYRFFDFFNGKFPPFACASEDKPMTNDKNGQETGRDKMVCLFICGLVIASAVSAWFAPNKFLALYKLGWLILGVGLFWLIQSADYKKSKLIFSMLTGIFLSACLGIWQFLYQATFANKWLGLALHRGADLGASVIEAVGAAGVGERWLRAYGSLDYPNMLGGMIVVVILLLIGQIIVRERIDNFQFLIFNFQIIFNDKIFKFINWFLVLALTAGLFFSFSRSAWLALAVGLAVMVALAIWQKNLKSQKNLAQIILAMAILVLVLFSQHQNLITARLNGQGRLEIKSTAERLESYQESWQIIKSNWLGGAGLGNYTLVLNQKLPDRPSYFYQPAHNLFLLALSEIGIFGLLFFVALLFVIARGSVSGRQENENKGSLDCSSVLTSAQKNKTGCLRGNDKDKRALHRNGQAAILAALIVLMFFDHWLWDLHFGVLFFWLIIGLVCRKSSAE
ncbi:MAG: O-antigen ligase family protein [bacterium]|nr:O-antigen ligase family protein [bacterium]